MCTYPTNYAATKGCEHPGQSIYLREDKIIGKLDEWLLSTFTADNLTELRTAMAEPEVDDGQVARVEAATRAVADCDARLAKCQAALEADADPVVVSGWIAEVKADRAARAAKELAQMPIPVELTDTQVAELVTSVEAVLKGLASAPADAKAELYELLGARLTYDPDRKVVVAEAHPPCAPQCVGGAMRTLTPRRLGGGRYEVA